MGFSLARIGVLHREQEVILAGGSSESKIVITEHVGTQNHTTNDTIDESSAEEEKPVKIVSIPEFLEEYLLLHNTLLLCGVETASINDCELKPSGTGIAVRLSSLVLEVVAG